MYSSSIICTSLAALIFPVSHINRPICHFGTTSPRLLVLLCLSPHPLVLLFLSPHPRLLFLLFSSPQPRPFILKRRRERGRENKRGKDGGKRIGGGNSGTTGSPKPIIWTHDWAASFTHERGLAPPPGLESMDRLMLGVLLFSLMPPFHVSCSNCCWFP